MLLYNWQKIFEAAKGNARECYLIVDMLVNNRIPYNRFDPLYKYMSHTFVGQSFLVNPDVLLFNAYKYSYRDLAIYMAIASVRSLSEYLANRKVTLELLRSPVDPRLELESDKLVTVDENNIIHFRYEEPPKSLIN